MWSSRTTPATANATPSSKQGRQRQAAGSATMRRIGDISAATVACLLLLGAGALAQEVPLSVTYGPAASTAEGDQDFRELIFFSVPADLQDRLYLRIFDPDTGGDHDLAYGGSENTETRYALFGGAGALVANVPPSAEDLAGGELIREQNVAASSALGSKWQTLASFSPDQGELVGGRPGFPPGGGRFYRGR